MIIRTSISFSLMLFCLLALGCANDEAPPSDNRNVEDERTPYARSVEKNRDQAKDALARTMILIDEVLGGSTPAASPKATGVRPPASSTDSQNQVPDIDKRAVSVAIEQLRLANDKLNEVLTSLSSVDGTEDSQKVIKNVQTASTAALSKLASVSNAVDGSGEDPLEPAKVRQNLLDARKEIESKALSQVSQIQIPKDLEEPDSAILRMVYDWAPTVGIVLAGFIALVLLYFAVKTGLKVSATRADTRIITKLQPIATNIQKQQSEVAAQISALTTSQDDLRTRVADLEFELKRVARIARDAAANDGAGHRLPTPQPVFTTFQEPIEKDEPVFPISIGDYLSKMRRSSNIVRPDFQNDILVSDPGGTGELVLIRDAAVADDLQPLFVVPRATQFQTKQDFYTYYQKYYECARPSAGDVWIIDPAVVSKVSGGWQLREKGVLEVR